MSKGEREPVHVAAGAADSATSNFRFVGGSLALDFVNTVNWTERGLERELLTGYEALVEWGVLAGVLPGESGERLRKGARLDPEGAARALARAYELRELLQRLFAAVAEGPVSELEVLDRFDGALAEARARRYLVPVAAGSEARGLEWRWRGLGEDLGSILWPVLEMAAELLVSPEVARLHLCAGEDCGWFFVDRSRNGLRRWCEMRTCGSVVKARRYYRRTRGKRVGGQREDDGG